MGTCKLRAGDRRESVIGYRSAGAEASSGGDGLSNYPAGRLGQPSPPAPGKGAPAGRSARGKAPWAVPGGGGCFARREPPRWGRGGGTTPRTFFPLHYRDLKYGSNTPHHPTTPPSPRAARSSLLPEPRTRTGSARRRARGAGGSRPPAPPPARRASAGRRNSSAFLPCASSLFLPLPGAAASFPTSTLPKLFSRSPERGALPQLPAAGSRLLLNFWGSRMSKMEKEIL